MSLQKVLIPANTALGLNFTVRLKLGLTTEKTGEAWGKTKTKTWNNSQQPWRVMSLLYPMSPLPSPPSPRELRRKWQRAEISALATRGAHPSKPLILRWLSALKHFVNIKARPLTPASIPWKGGNYINSIFNREKKSIAVRPHSQISSLYSYLAKCLSVWNWAVTFTSVAWKNLTQVSTRQILQINATPAKRFHKLQVCNPLRRSWLYNWAFWWG